MVDHSPSLLAGKRVVITRAESQSFGLAEALRAEGLRIVVHAGGGSFKSQMRKADASGAMCALIVGEEELAREEVSLKFLRKDGEQQRLKRHEVPEYLRRG